MGSESAQAITAAMPLQPIAAATKQSDRHLFWHFGLTAYQCAEKPDGHTVLRIRRIVGSRTKLPKDYVVPPVEATPSELVGATGGYIAINVLWLGMRLDDAGMYRLNAGSEKDKRDIKIAKDKGNGKANTTSVNGIIDGGSIHLIGHDAKALRVVIDLTRGTNQLNVFVLVNPDEQGLCEAYSTDKEEVWWHHLYRDDNTDSVERRRTTWRARLQSPPPWAIVARYRVDPSIERLQKAMASLELVHKDLKSRPAQDGEGVLERLVDKASPFEPTDCEIAVQTINRINPAIEKNASYLVSNDAIALIALAVRNSSQVVPLSYIRHMVIDFCRKFLGTNAMSAEESALWCGPAFEDSLLTAPIYCLDSSGVCIADEGLNDDRIELCANFLRDHISLLNMALSDMEQSTARLQQVAGLPKNDLFIIIKDVMDRLANTVDRDEVYFWATEIMQYLMQSLLQTYDSNDELLRSYLRHCRNLLRQCVDNDWDEEAVDAMDTDGGN